MKAYQHERAHRYEHSYHAFDFKSASLFHSLTTAITIGVFVGLIGVALNVVWFYRQTSWHVTATVDGLVQMLSVTVLVTIVLEQRRKRAIRRTL
jgi:heme/copper-type cytochrome/quinol oxidase subunit 2